jgi:hypothetical protein
MTIGVADYDGAARHGCPKQTLQSHPKEKMIIIE